MSMYNLPQQTVINDISGYTTKSRKNLVDNNSNIVSKKRFDNCSSAILQDLNTEDDYAYNLNPNHDTDECPENKESDGISLITSKSWITDKRLPKEITKQLIQSEHEHPWSSSKSKISKSPSYCSRSEFSLKSHYESSNRPVSPETRPKWKGSGKHVSQDKSNYSWKSKERKIEAPQVQVDLEKEIKKNQIMFVKKQRSPTKRTVKNRNTNLSKDFHRSSGHSQTVDWLRHTIKSKNEQLKSLNVQAHSLKGKMSKQIEFVKSFETISKKLKDRLESSSTIVKKINQWSMVFLNFYKDFVDMLKENQDVLNQAQENKWLQLRDQLEACLKLLDIETNDRCNTNNQAIFKELQELLNKYNDSNLDISTLSRNFAPCSPKASMEDNQNYGGTSMSGGDKTFELTSPISASHYGSKRDMSSSSISWVTPAPDPESLRKDIIRLTEENKYLKKRMTGNIAKELF